MVRRISRLGWIVGLMLLMVSGTGCPSSQPKPPAEGDTGKAVAKPAESSTKKNANASPVGAAWRFDEIAQQAGLRWTYRNGVEADRCAMIETLGGGVALTDFDGDGWLDLFLTGGGTVREDFTATGLPSALFRNLGERNFVAVSSVARVDVPGAYTHGVVAGDYDADGFPDLLVTGFGGLALWQNQGDGTFVERHLEARLVDTEWTSSAAWGDVNGDGLLDLFIDHYVDWSPTNHPRCETSDTKRREICPPRMFRARPNLLYLNQGDGTFADTTEAAGVGAAGKGLGVVAGDIDLDGDLDLYVGNDTVENFLFLNDGRGHFEEVGLRSGVATNEEGVPDGSMGVDICDFDNNGLPDLWAANYEREAFALYRNLGNTQFIHVSQTVGITALAGLFVGWGTVFADFDRDGDEDVVVACGHVLKYPAGAPLRQSQLLLENTRGRFRRAAFPKDHYFSRAWEARGVAAGDLDNDGDLDVAISHVNEPSALLVNETRPVGDWVGVRLIGRRSNRDAIGAHLVLKTTAGNQLRLVKGGGSYISQSDYRVFWGLPTESRAEQLEIHWPSGVVQTMEPPLNQWQTIVEPDDSSTR